MVALGRGGVGDQGQGDPWVLRHSTNLWTIINIIYLALLIKEFETSITHFLLSSSNQSLS